MSGTNVTVTESGVRVATIAQGPAGRPGSTILGGHGVPANTLGADNDWYIDLDSALFYGPKTAGAWGSGFAIRGPHGASVLTVSGAPDNTLDGIDGDFACDPATLIFYGPKAAGTWPAGTPISAGPTRQIRVLANVASRTIRQADAPGGRDVVFLCEGATVFHVLANATEPLIAGTTFGFLDLGGLQPSIVFDSPAADVVYQNGNKTSGAGSPMSLYVLDTPDAYVISGDTTT